MDRIETFVVRYLTVLALWNPKNRHENKKYFQSQQKGQKGREESERGAVRPMAALQKY